MMAVRSGRKRGRTLHRLFARVEICLFILAFPGWAFPYMLVVGMAGWEPVDAGWIVPGVWPLLWVVLTTRRIVAHARARSRVASHETSIPATMLVPSKFGVWLRHIREQHLGWSPYELAVACGVPIAVIHGWESGRIPEPDPDQRQRIFAAIYGLLR